MKYSCTAKVAMRYGMHKRDAEYNVKCKYGYLIKDSFLQKETATLQDFMRTMLQLSVHNTADGNVK